MTKPKASVILIILFVFISISDSFSGGLLFKPLTANVFEPRVGTMYQFDDNKLRLDIGTSIDLFELQKTDTTQINIGTDFFTFSHLRSEGNMNAPYCTDCHGGHNTKSKDDLESPTFARYIPDLCGKCHSEGMQADTSYKGTQHDIIKNYSMSIHGKGLLQSGLMVTATCVDCHTAHRELPSGNPGSTVSKDNIAKICSNCHLGIFEQFKNSVHSPTMTQTDKEFTCLQRLPQRTRYSCYQHY